MVKQRHKLTICGSLELSKTINKSRRSKLMPEIIIEQNQNIRNYINVLQLPYSAALNNHIINMVSGIITAEGNKTISAIYRRLTSNRDRSTGSRFLSEYKWNNEYVDYKRISILSARMLMNTTLVS